jgi:hypothetical protein
LRRHARRYGPGLRRVERVSTFGVVGEEIEDFSAQLRIITTGRIEEAHALVTSKRQRRRKDFPCPNETLAIDGWTLLTPDGPVVLALACGGMSREDELRFGVPDCGRNFALKCR